MTDNTIPTPTNIKALTFIWHYATLKQTYVSSNYDYINDFNWIFICDHLTGFRTNIFMVFDVGSQDGRQNKHG